MREDTRPLSYSSIALLHRSPRTVETRKAPQQVSTDKQHAMHVHIRTYGCQMNCRDSEAAAALLREHGYSIVDDPAEADIYIANTCSVRAKAEAKAIGKLTEVLAENRAGHNRLVGAIGCMAERLQAALFERIPGLHFAIGTHQAEALPRVLAEARAGERGILRVGRPPRDPAPLRGHEPGKLSAFVNILLGCNRRCSYCIVPDVRGPERSRPAAEIRDEVAKLAAGGVREVTLLGQSVMRYGAAPRISDALPASAAGFTEPFPRLLEWLCSVPGLARLRFTSGHPHGCTQELARAIAASGPVCEHLHLPLQSGSDRILRLMRRGYDTATYRDAVRELREAVPALALTTDIIVGFPTETEAEFEQTRAFMEEIAFDNAFVFKYSPRPGTEAAGWEDSVPAREKARRNRVLLEAQAQRAERIHRALIGQALEVLVEGVSKRNPHRWTGRTRTNKIVVFDKPPNVQAGELLTVVVEKVTALTLFGRAGG